MATNHYFNNSPDRITNEQLLIEDLVIESMKIHGIDCYYIPRESRDQIDSLFGEEQLKGFNNAYVLEFYIQNAMGMEGEQDLISKFGLEIRDEMHLLVSRRRFRFTVPNVGRPREGDLVFIPMMKNFYEITFVEHENDAAMYYTLGRGKDANVYVFSLKMRQFVFSEERIRTGVEQIDDSIIPSYRPTELVFATGSGDYDFVHSEIVYQGANLALATATANAVSWEPATNTLNVILVTGEFLPGANVVGVDSGAEWTIATIETDTPLDDVFEDSADNKLIQNEANTILDWSESNPFGNP
jgi:hypothetical protein